MILEKDKLAIELGERVIGRQTVRCVDRSENAPIGLRPTLSNRAWQFRRALLESVYVRGFGRKRVVWLYCR